MYDQGVQKLLKILQNQIKEINNELLFSTLYVYIRRLITLSVIMNMKPKDIHIFLTQALKTFLYDFGLFYRFFHYLRHLTIDALPTYFK